jgi:hypothetical protein
MKRDWKTFWLIPSALLLAAGQAAAKAPSLQDFAWRQPIIIDGDRPIQELALPDTVYASALNDNLGDLRVFNNSGGVVPHAICPAATPVAAEPRLETLKPFALQSGVTAVTGESGRIELRTADGTQLTVTEHGNAVSDASEVIGYVIDLRALEQPVRAVRLNWQSSNQASEATVSLKTSEDLSQWMTLMPNATLLKAQSGEQTLQRSRIPLPEREYGFLRFDAGGSGPLPRIESVVVEMATEPDPVPVSWIEATTQAPDKAEKAVAFWFDSARVAPVHSADLRLPAANMALHVQLQSRDAPEHGWRTRWSGEVFALSSDNYNRGQTVIGFEPTTDRFWRVEILRGSETLSGLSPSLLLGYRPARLRFLAQGDGPYQLAYGSARVERLTPACDSLLSSLPAQERESMTGQAQPDPDQRQGNANALKPLPKPTPVRQMVLWGVLIAGALLVAAMALSLLKKLRQE